jgi:hypothetical protein
MTRTREFISDTHTHTHTHTHTAVAVVVATVASRPSANFAAIDPLPPSLGCCRHTQPQWPTEVVQRGAEKFLQGGVVVVVVVVTRSVDTEHQVGDAGRSRDRDAPTAPTRCANSTERHPTGQRSSHTGDNAVLAFERRRCRYRRFVGQ